MATKWNGRMIANLVRKSKLNWNSGSLQSGDTHCAVGLLARALGASRSMSSEVPCEELSKIFPYNDRLMGYHNTVTSNREQAAQQIEEMFGDTEFDVQKYENKIRARSASLSEPFEPDCELLEEVKREEEEYQARKATSPNGK